MRERSSLEVFFAFLKLGFSSFGGPVAHLGYFRSEFVVKRHWIDDVAYSDLVALCQFLPGPASSQVAFSLGLVRAGYWGGVASWLGFTLPSAVALTAFAYGAKAFTGPLGAGTLHGLVLVAVAIVAQAVWGMARRLCPDRQRAFIAGVGAIILLISASALAQLGVIILGGIAGLILCRSTGEMPGQGIVVRRNAQTVGVAALGAFLLLLVGLPALAGHVHGVALFNAFYHSGALVFGGGHVVLPLLSNSLVTPGWVSPEAFLAGYGAAQAIPGPLFTFAAYLGAVSTQAPHGIAGAAVALIAIFLPGLLILNAALPLWDSLRQRPVVQGVMQGINAAVVGLLGAALYDPLWTSAVHTLADFSLVVVGYVLLTAWQVPAVLVVIAGALAGTGLSYLAA